MSGGMDGSQVPSGWTYDTLLIHVELQFRLLREQLDRQWREERRATDIALRAHDEALAVARDNVKESIQAALAAQKEMAQLIQTFSDQRAASMNEWRRSLDDVLTKAMGRKEAEAAIERVTSAIGEIRLRQETQVSRPEHDALRDRVAAIENMKAGGQERTTEVRGNVTYVIAIIGALLLLAGFVITQALRG